MEFKLKKLNPDVSVPEIANVHFFDFPKGYQTIDDKHPFCELIFVGKGHISVSSETYSGTLKKNEILIHPSNSRHSFTCPNKTETTLIIIGFGCSCAKLQDFSNKPTLLDEQQIQRLAEIVKEGRNVFAPPYNVPVYNMIKKKNIAFGSEQMLRGCIESFLIDLIRKREFLENNAAPEKAPFAINEILEYLDNNYTEKITLDELAFLFRTNRSTLCKSFRQTTGKSLGEYLTDKKISMAKKLLMEKEQSVTEIAETLNFDNVPYFCKFFKLQTGMSPSQYRKTL